MDPLISTSYMDIANSYRRIKERRGAAKPSGDEGLVARFDLIDPNGFRARPRRVSLEVQDANGWLTSGTPS